jgi:hypothetical protein
MTEQSDCSVRFFCKRLCCSSAWASGDLCGTPTNAYLIVNWCTLTSAFAGSAVVFNSENFVLIQPY